MVEVQLWSTLAQQFTVMIGILSVFKTCGGNIVVGPTDVITAVNKTVTLECMSNANTFVKWKHCPVDGMECNFINREEKLEEPFLDRFSLNKGCSSGNCTLTMRDVQLSDVGEYCCVDEESSLRTEMEIGEMNCFLLTIVTDIECFNDAPDGAISGTSCGIPPDKVHHTCRVHYEGRTPPSIVWTDEAGSTLYNPHQIVENLANVVSSEIQLEATASGIGVKCQVESLDVSCASKYHSYYAYNSSDIITLSHGSITCNVISSVPCNPTWHLTGNASFDGNNPVLNFSTDSFISGEYVCSASCRPCHVRGLTVKFDPAAKCDCSEFICWFKDVKTIVLIVIFIVILIIVVVCACCARSCSKLLCSWVRKLNKKLRKYSSVQQKDDDRPTTKADTNVAEDVKLTSVNTTADEPTPLFGSTLYGEVKVRGMTVIDNIVYFVFNRSKTIEKYDLIKKEKIDSIVVPQLESPWGLAKCNNNRFIHISECDNSEGAHIFTIDLEASDASKRIRRWPVSKEYRRGWVRISVSEANNNLVVCGRMSSKIEVYSYDTVHHEKRLPVIALKSNVTDIQQAIQLWNEDVIFIHGFADGKHHRICRMNKQSEEIFEEEYLSTPTDVVATRSGRIYVADYNSHRVLILNNELKFVNEVNLDSQPRRLFIDDREEFLYIGSVPGNILRWKI